MRSRGTVRSIVFERSRVTKLPHLFTRQYARIVAGWIVSIGLDPATYGTHTMRRTKATLIYRRTKSLRAVQLLLGRTKLEGTVRYLGIEVDDVLEMAEQTEMLGLLTIGRSIYLVFAVWPKRTLSFDPRGAAIG